MVWAEDPALKALKRCLRDAHNDSDRAECQRKFEGDGGTVDGGKVFTSPDGTAVYVTDGGKVFRLDPS